MEQMKIFTEYFNAENMEAAVNEWLTKNEDKIVIIDRFVTQSGSGDVTNVTITIFYANKH